MNIKQWYLQEYPSDDLGNDINRNATFQELFETMDCYKSVYDYLQVNDSLVRERVFEKLAEVMQVEYDYIYDQWMLCND